jgi:phosphatidylinositol alpha-mannosyltransferase
MMRIGLISPYSFDAPGGVQFHILDLADELRSRGHYVSILAPAGDETELPDGVTSAGRAVPVRYNGSVARLSFGPRAANRTKAWLDEHLFDLIHPHEPITPSVSLLAIWEATVPIVATFHSSQTRSRALQLALPMLRSSLDKIDARIAVSEDARRTAIDHIGGDAIVIPNGVNTAKYATGKPARVIDQVEPKIVFLGRLDEPRKGLPVLTEAIPSILNKIPGARFLVAGHGDIGKQAAVDALGDHLASVEFLGQVSDQQKIALLQTADFYVAPQTGGESFGIVLIEAMAAGARVVASDLGAFRRVLADGRAGTLFPVGNSQALANAIIDAVRSPKESEQALEYGLTWVKQFDWEVVTNKILAVYEMVLETAAAPTPDPLAARLVEKLKVTTNAVG